MPFPNSQSARFGDIDSYDIFPSDDFTGAEDTALIQRALTTCRLAGGGLVRGLPGAKYYINAPLVIGSLTTLDMTGCTVVLVAGSNGLMLKNYAHTAPVASGNIAFNAGSNVVTEQTPASNPISIYLADVKTNHDRDERYALSVTAPLPFGGGVPDTIFTATAETFFYAPGFGSFPIDALAPFGNSVFVLGSLYRRDYGMQVIGGVWDRGANVGTGGGSEVEDNHIFRFRYADDVLITGQNFVSSSSNGLYAVLLQAVTHVDCHRIKFGLNPSSFAWAQQTGYKRDGIHISGPARHINVSRLFGTPGDDMVAIVASDYPNAVGNLAGNVSDCSFSDIHADYCGASAVKINAGIGTRVERIKVDGVFGHGLGRAVIWIADDPSHAEVQGGVYDQISVQNVQAKASGGALDLPYVYLAGALGRVRLSEIMYDEPNGTNDGVIELGTGAGGAAVATTIDELTIDKLTLKSLGAGVKALFDGGHATVTRLITSGWSDPKTNFPKVALTGAVGRWDMRDRIDGGRLTAQTASIGATTIFAVPSGGAGVYRITLRLVVTAAGSGGTVLASAVTNNGSVAVTQNSAALNLNALGEGGAVFEARCAAGTNVQYSTTVAGATGGPQYSLDVRVEFLG